MKYFLYPILLFLFLTFLFCTDDNPVQSQNSPPVIESISMPFSMTENNAVRIVIIAHDEDGDELSYYLSNIPVSGGNSGYFNFRKVENLSDNILSRYKWTIDWWPPAGTGQHTITASVWEKNASAPVYIQQTRTVSILQEL